jgi:phosphoglycolate phosphatase
MTKGDFMIIFWDIDGTLIKNDPHSVNLYNEALKQALNATASTSISHHGKVDKQIIHEYLADSDQTKEHYPAVKEKLEQLSTLHYLNPVTARKPLPQVNDMLNLAASLGHINALLTGNSPLRSRVKLEGAGFDLDMFKWEQSFFGSEYNTRPAMAEAAKKFHSEALIIGDTPGDGVAAATAGFHFLAVCTGVYTAEELTPYNPVLTIQNFTDGFQQVEQLFKNRLANQ